MKRKAMTEPDKDSGTRKEPAAVPALGRWPNTALQRIAARWRLCLSRTAAAGPLALRADVRRLRVTHMQDLLLKVLTDTAAFTIAGAVLLFAGRKILSSTIEHYFTKLADTSKASVELEKQKESFLLSTRNSVYPEIVELVYRLRNTFRDGLHELKESASRTDDRWWPHSFSFGEPLYILTERLYKYRAFVPEEVFGSLHRFKRCLQDATVILNRLDRPVEREGEKPEDFGKKDREVYRQRYAESIGKLEALFSDIDTLYPQITEAIRTHMESVLSRKS